jgi:hypothetical protein
MRRGGTGRVERLDAAPLPCFLFRGLRSGCDGRRECDLAIPAGEEYPKGFGSKGHWCSDDCWNRTAVWGANWHDWSASMSGHGDSEALATRRGGTGLNPGKQWLESHTDCGQRRGPRGGSAGRLSSRHRAAAEQETKPTNRPPDESPICRCGHRAECDVRRTDCAHHRNFKVIRVSWSRWSSGSLMAGWTVMVPTKHD